MLVAAGVLAVPASAAACSCAGGSPGERLRASDAAVIAKLKHVEPISGNAYGQADFTYRVRRVFKGRHQYDLRAGDRLVIRSYLSEATCGLPQQKRLYGLLLYESRRGLSANLCTVISPAALRRAAAQRDGGSARLSAGPLRCEQRARA